MNFTNLLKALTSIYDLLAKFTKTYGKKALVVVLFSIAISVGICLTNNYMLNKSITRNLEEFRTDMKNDMFATLKKYQSEEDSLRYIQENYMIEQQAAVKSMMKKHRTGLGADYILLLQFHNNVSSLAGVQFIKFDITYSVAKPGLANVDIDDFQNTNITKYDIVPYLWDRNVVECDISELDEIDELFCSQIKRYAPTAKKVVFTHLTIKNSRDGVIMYLFDDHTVINYLKIAESTSDLSDLITTGIEK